MREVTSHICDTLINRVTSFMRDQPGARRENRGRRTISTQSPLTAIHTQAASYHACWPGPEVLKSAQNNIIFNICRSLTKEQISADEEAHGTWSKVPGQVNKWTLSWGCFQGKEWTVKLNSLILSTWISFVNSTFFLKRINKCLFPLGGKRQLSHLSSANLHSWVSD